jgi:hypothetical protein
LRHCALAVYVFCGKLLPPLKTALTEKYFLHNQRYFSHKYLNLHYPLESKKNYLTIMKKLICLVLVFTAVFFSACSESEGFGHGDSPNKKVPFRNYSNAAIIQWHNVALQTMQQPAYDPMIASRIFAMVHIAMHDALNGIAPLYTTYSLQQQDKKADPVAALSAAAYTVLVETFPDKKVQLDSALAQAIADIKSADAKERGLALGEIAGKAIVALRNDDGAFQNPIAEINNPLEPGLYQGVPPTPFVYAPFWATLKPFGLVSPEQFRIAAMPALNSTEYTEDFNEVKLKGVKENSTRTAEETTIAKFWYELSEIGWNRVTATVATDKNLDLLSTARLFALVNIALADSYIAGWDSKFHYNFWRPYTAVRAAATDGNDNTSEDASWEPLMNTPPVHDYPSTHSTLGNAAATVLNELIGENIGFTMTSTTAEPANSTRSFVNFSKAAEENADSRVFAGIHFRFSCEKGLELGKQIGDYTLGHHLKPRSDYKGL